MVNKNLKIGILGTRGIPNHYGGFEQFAEFLAPGLVERGHQVWVYNSHHHPYQESSWKGVELIHCYDPENKMGTAGQFIYDFNCIRDARLRGFDVLLQLGYTSSSIWGPWLPENAVVFTNMDGLEWKRSKYGKAVKAFLRRAEQWAVKTSDVLIADSRGIADYLHEKFHKHAEFIAYGAEVFSDTNPLVLQKYAVDSENFYLLIARLEPENNIEMILDGYVLSGDPRPFLVVGKTENHFGEKMKARFSGYTGIRFCGGIYDLNDLNNLRYFCRLYFHGHSVGGTNPSLLEAMASQAVIAANNNPFNLAVLQDEAFYFESPNEVRDIIMSGQVEQNAEAWKSANQQKIARDFRWDQIIDRYEAVFQKHVKKQQS